MTDSLRKITKIILRNSKNMRKLRTKITNNVYKIIDLGKNLVSLQIQKQKDLQKKFFIYFIHYLGL